MSTENVAADSWDDANADPVGTLVEKMEKVKLLQRKEQKKEQFFEKVKSEDGSVAAPKIQAQEGSEVPVEEPKRVFLRRPKDGFTAETISDSSPESAQSAESRSDIGDRQSARNETKKASKTLEQRQAAYQAARDRIMGPSYKPDNQEIKEIKFIDRSKSPETLRMTEKNMVEHYGEELSRELMQQPVAPAVTQERQFVSDFSQPPPNLMKNHDGEYFNGPPGFHQGPQQHFIGARFFPQPMNNSQIPLHFPPNQQNFQHLNQQFVPPDVPVVSSSSQNTQIDGKNEQAFLYYQQAQVQHNQQQMNCIAYNLPNMSYPPPNMIPAHSNQMIQMQQQNPPPFYTQQYPQKVRYQNQNEGRGRGPPPMMYPMVNGAMAQQPPHIQQPNQYRAPQNGVPNRNSGGGQTRQFQSNQQNGQSNQSNQGNNGRRNNNRNNGKGPQGAPNFQVPPPGQQGGNIIPFGCPPNQANAIREQYGMANPGAGLLGAHPSVQHWNGPQQ